MTTVINILSMLALTATSIIMLIAHKKASYVYPETRPIAIAAFFGLVFISISIMQLFEYDILIVKYLSILSAAISFLVVAITCFRWANVIDMMHKRFTDLK